MKRLLVFVLLACAFPRFIFAAEIIHRLDVKADIAQDRTVTFDESIEYDFGSEERHGILRDIPMTYSRNGGTYRLRLEVLSVSRNGAPEPFEQSTSGGELHLKIGDANKTITGSHVYQIRYRSDRALNDFSNHTELYWNAVGTSWPVSIEQSTMQVNLPTDVGQANVSSTCFVGAYGSTEQSCSMRVNGTGVVFSSNRVLNPREGFTTVIGFPLGTVKVLTLSDKVRQTLQDNGILLLPVLVFIGMFIRWWNKGRDPSLGTVIPEYEAPPTYTPALLASAASEGDIPDRAITATIIDLAQRGYLHIRFGEEKGLLFGSTPTYTFVRTNKDTKDLLDYEHELYNGIFKETGTTELKDLKKPEAKFYSTIANFKKLLQHHVDEKNLFDANPTNTRAMYIAFAFAFGIALSFFIKSGLGIFSVVLSGLIIAIFGWIMPRRNAAGMQLLQKAKGFEWFMSVTEKDRLDFHNAPERTPQQFMAVLPFAIAFGLEKKWAQQFASLNMPPPEWAEGATISNFSTASLVSNLGTMHSTAATSFSPPSSSGSGGSGFSGGGSGGGGGGGGGGSW